MDLVTALTTLIGLLSTFKQEHTADEQLDHRKFMEWLEAHRHEELKELIANTHHLSHEVDVLLREDHQKILDELNTVGSVLGTILSCLDGFSGIVKALAPELELSDQAKGILTTFAGATARQMMLLPDHRQVPQVLLLGGSGVQQMQVQEERFLEDDFAILVNLGFLAEDYSPDGKPLYRLTRNGAKYAELLQD